MGFYSKFNTTPKEGGPIRHKQTMRQKDDCGSRLQTRVWEDMGIAGRGPGVEAASSPGKTEDGFWDGKDAACRDHL